MKTISAAALAAMAGAAAAQAPTAPPAPPAPAQAPAAVPDVHALRNAFVPLVAAPFDMTQKSDPIWVAGARPAKNIIARLSLQPVEAVAAEGDAGQGAGKPLVLLRAFTGEPGLYFTSDDLKTEGERIYCADAAAVPTSAGRLYCLIDANADGAFESKAWGVAEGGTRADQLAVIGPSAPLPAPVRYRAATAAEAPPLDAVIANCRKDHDRPGYSFSVTGRPGDPTLAELTAGVRTPGPAFPSSEEQAAAKAYPYLVYGYGIGCETGEKVKPGDKLRPATLAKGAAVARLAELVIEVGPKDAGAPVRLLGLREPKRLYRLDRWTVFPLSDRLTEKQRALAVQQKFDKPVIATSGAIEVLEGDKEVGDVILTTGFNHGYMGVLKQETKIRTLLSSRSVPAGTVVYGIPMSTRVVTTYGGYPKGLLPGPSGTIPDAEDVHLVWCVPVQDETKWTATCLPTEGGERYTILKGQSPAFEVSSLSYAVGTTTNAGAIPVTIQPGDFGKPLSYRFKIKAISEQAVTLAQETLFGDQVVYTRDHQVMRLAGRDSGMLFSGGVVVLSGIDGAPGKVRIRKEGTFQTGQMPTVRSGPLADRISPPVAKPAEPK